MRTWESRVRGVSQKVRATPVDPAATNGDRHDEAVAVVGDPRPSAPMALAEADLNLRSGEPTVGSRPGADPSGAGSRNESLSVTLRAETNALCTGLMEAVHLLGGTVFVAERESGRVLWVSDGWMQRFGRQLHAGRYLASATELGETPLPPPGETWRRTRSVYCAAGGEELADLILVGRSADGVDIVTVAAVERSAGTTSVITDRAELIAIIDNAIAESEPSAVAVLCADIDRFKIVHELVGSHEAARLLDVIGRRLAVVARDTDLFFRLPSDEFVVLCTELDDVGTAEDLAEQIRNSVATMSGQGYELALTASVGVALAGEESTGEALLSAADAAVDLAKGRGRNRIAVHDDELRNRTRRLLIVERQLRRAIEQEHVGVAFQPLVHLASRTVVGAEALLRLGSEIGLSAVEVIAAAEHSGLMGALGSLVVDGMEEQLNGALREPAPDRLFMCNLSATQLADDNLTAKLRALAADESLPVGRLGVEVPEIVVREKGDDFLELARQLSPRFKIGLDGFGTTYDSLSRLADLPIDYVKLHRSLTASIGTDNDGRDEIRALVEGLRARGLTVIALGVERQDQAAVLEGIGCSLAQGFLFAGAVRSSELTGLIDRGFSNND